jgi:hypothetical protein
MLTTASTIQCAHGAPAMLVTGNSRVSAGARVLVENDAHKVVGCTFTTGSDDSPCVEIAWTAGAGEVSIGGVAPLLTSSVGTCKNAEGVTQGVAIIASTQQRASAR